MLEGKYLRFIKIWPEAKKLPVYRIANRKDEYLGILSFYPQWRKYVFAPSLLCKFDATCLSEIIDALNIINEKRREGLLNEED